MKKNIKSFQNCTYETVNLQKIPKINLEINVFECQLWP